MTKGFVGSQKVTAVRWFAELVFVVLCGPRAEWDMF